MKYQAILFDLIGTTVIEKGPATLVNCMEEAFEDCGIQVEKDFITENRGKSKKDMIEIVLQRHNKPICLADKIFKSFEINIENSVDNFVANNGADKVFAGLKQAQIKIGIGSGLPVNIFDKIFDHLNWARSSFDYIGIFNKPGKSRPDPYMIFDMMQKLTIKNGREFLKAGDTIADIQEGKNANVATAVILSGTQSKDKLIAAKPDFVLEGLEEILDIID